MPIDAAKLQDAIAAVVEAIRAAKQRSDECEQAYKLEGAARDARDRADHKVHMAKKALLALMSEEATGGFVSAVAPETPAGSEGHA